MISWNAAARRREQECVSGDPAKLRQCGVKKKKSRNDISNENSLVHCQIIPPCACLAGWLAALLVEITPGYNNTRPCAIMCRWLFDGSMFPCCVSWRGFTSLTPSLHVCTVLALALVGGEKKKPCVWGGGVELQSRQHLHRGSLWAGGCSAAQDNPPKATEGDETAAWPISATESLITVLLPSQFSEFIVIYTVERMVILHCAMHQLVYSIVGPVVTGQHRKNKQ